MSPETPNQLRLHFNPIFGLVMLVGAGAAGVSALLQPDPLLVVVKLVTVAVFVGVAVALFVLPRYVVDLDAGRIDVCFLGRPVRSVEFGSLYDLEVIGRRLHLADGTPLLGIDGGSVDPKDWGRLWEAIEQPELLEGWVRPDPRDRIGEPLPADFTWP